jgi:hypothetical protein
MKKLMSSVAVSLAMILLSVPLIYGQDLSKYRNLSLGTSLADVSKLINKKPADAIVVHQRPALIQQLTWWPARNVDSSLGGEAVQEIRFSFFNDKLYRIAVTYDNTSTRGLTPEDMAKAITATYGTPTGLAAGQIKDNYGALVKVLAGWEDSQYSLSLFQSSLSNSFGLLIIMKQLDAQADDASAEAVKLEIQEAPDKELARVKKQADDLEAVRQKNVETFRP